MKEDKTYAIYINKQQILTTDGAHFPVQGTGHGLDF